VEHDQSSFTSPQSSRNQHNAVATQSTNIHLLQSLLFNSLVDAPHSLKSLHPSPSTILFIWQTYLDVVDPLLKIFHIPSTQRQVMSMSKGREVDAPTECLMFVIYYSAVISLSAAECLDELNEERPVLLQRCASFSIFSADFYCFISNN
jgi:hypothetical protein